MSTRKWCILGQTSGQVEINHLCFSCSTSITMAGLAVGQPGVCVLFLLPSSIAVSLLCLLTRELSQASLTKEGAKGYQFKWFGYHLVMLVLFLCCAPHGYLLNTPTCLCDLLLESMRKIPLTWEISEYGSVDSERYSTNNFSAVLDVSDSQYGCKTDKKEAELLTAACPSN